jgi:hypothetical protein
MKYGFNRFKMVDLACRKLKYFEVVTARSKDVF